MSLTLLGAGPSASTTGVSARPSNSVLPAISGTATSGQPLTTTTGSWTNTPLSYAYQWFRDGVLVADKTTNAYLLANEDIAALITVRVTATNAAGSRFVFSDPTAAIAATAGVFSVMTYGAVGDGVADDTPAIRDAQAAAEAYAAINDAATIFFPSSTSPLERPRVWKHME